ncbi:MAG: hypothetical protein ACRDVP_04440 [Acidimicrobiales bacterium]
MAVSTRVKDPRTASQLAVLVSLPTVAINSLIAFNVITASLALGLGLGAGLAVLDRIGWTLTSQLFDRETLVTSIR